MPQFQPGDVVVTTFPFADKTGTKLRPALVLRDTGDDDLIIALISTSSTRSAFDVILAGSLTPRDWAQVRTRVTRLWATI